MFKSDMIHPPIFSSKSMSPRLHGNHNPLRIKLNANSPNYWATRAEEIIESQLILIAGLPFTLTLLAVFYYNAGFPALSFTAEGLFTALLYYAVIPLLAYSIGQNFPFFISPLTRYMEFRGKAASALVAQRDYGVDIEVFITKLASELSNYKQFKGWSKPEIESGIVKMIPKVRGWVNNSTPKPANR